MNLKTRAFKALNLDQYRYRNYPDEVGIIKMQPPEERQYVLRMLIKRPFGDYKIPDSIQWCKTLIDESIAHQESLGIHQPFCYVTIRNGIVDSVTDDEWHVDGFSLRITHLPEQNYVWVNKKPTEIALRGIAFPSDFDSHKHNIHKYIQQELEKGFREMQLDPMMLCCMDPYVIHRRPPNTSGLKRCFVRISFTPIEIDDINNTINPLLETNYTRDGVKDFRDTLETYERR